MVQVVKKAKHVDAAIAYFGSNGARLLPLRRGHCLIVDMSVGTVKAGATNPHEIEKLLRKGVRVFTRRNLHAKFVVTETNLIVGSANVSGHSMTGLEEAGIMTADHAAIRRAREHARRLCTEPIREEYLRICKRLYQSPHFEKKTRVVHRQKRAAQAKLWIVNLREFSVPKKEQERFERGEVKAKEMLANKSHSIWDAFHWSSRPKMASRLEVGDWFVQVLEHKDKKIAVYPPGQFLLLDDYARGPRKRRYVFHLEIPKHGQTMSWARFRQKIGPQLGFLKGARPRTMPVNDVQVADSILSLWTSQGKLSRRR